MAKNIASRIILAIPTYRREDGLSRLLDAVGRLAVPTGIEFSVLVVDNAPAPEVQTLVTAKRAHFPFPLLYDWVPARGLSKVRNHALTAALNHNATHLAFIDDDEIPRVDWLWRHLDMLAQTSADASMGSVHALFTAPAPTWIRRGGFLDLKRLEDGKPSPYGATSNIVFSLKPVKAGNLKFNTRYDFAGGEDTVFFHDYAKVGGKIVFAAKAIVDETIPSTRASLGWLWRRWRRTGQTNGEIFLGKGRGKLANIGCISGGVVRVFAGLTITLLTAPAALVGDPGWARGLRIAARGAGFIDAALGRRTLEYAAPER